MKASKMRDMSKDDLLLEESELRKQLLRLRFQAATGQTGERSENEGHPQGHRTDCDGSERNGKTITIDDSRKPIRLESLESRI